MSTIIINTGTLSAGGAERVLSILSKPLTDAFDEVQYVMWLDAKYPDIFYEIDPRVKIVRMSKESGSTKIWKQIIWYRKYVKHQKTNIVLSFMVMVGFTVTMALLGTGIPQIIAERNDPRYFTGPKLLRKFINFAYRAPDVKAILMQTQSNKDYFTSKTLYNKTEVIYNPITMDYSMVGKALSTKKEDLIVSVGRLTSQKRHDRLIKAFAEFYKSHPSYKLCFWGEGEKREELQNLADAIGLHDAILFPGRSNKVMDEICSAKMFVMTSEYEGMSNALLEAMCLGLPCISTKVSGATDLINHEENGYLIEHENLQQLVSIMSRVADSDAEAIRIGQNAYKAFDKLSVDIIAKKWVEYLKERMRQT